MVHLLLMRYLRLYFNFILEALILVCYTNDVFENAIEFSTQIDHLFRIFRYIKYLLFVF